MDLKCEHCDKEFNTNTGLYNHKKMVHKTPRVVLVSHDHNDKPSTNRKRKLITDDHDVKNSKKRKNSDQHDENLEIIDEYNDSDDSDVRLPKAKEPEDKDLNTSESEDSDDLSNVEESSILPTSKSNYKDLYNECMKNYKKMKLRFKTKIVLMNRREKIKQRQKMDQIISERDEKMSEIKDRFKRQIRDLENKNNECNDRIKKLDDDHQNAVNILKSKHKEELNELEIENKQKIKHFQDLIKNMQDEDSDYTKLSSAGINCTTIEEIFEIQNLIKNHQLNELTQNHLKTIQKLLINLSYGIIPLCDSQRQAITQPQRKLVEKIQHASPSSAKRLMKESRQDFVNLFTIINGSLKLMRDSFNQYSNRN